MEGTIGEIRIFAGNFAPRGWAFCDGRLYPINQWQAVFSILGTLYGGDGVTTFAVPNLVSPAQTDGSFNGRYIVCMQGIYPYRP